MKPRASLLDLLAIGLLLALFATQAHAQTAAPPPAPPAPVVTDAGDGCVIDLPANWTRSGELVTQQGFLRRADATLVATFHPIGSRPTDLPFALLEQFRTLQNPTQAEQAEAAEMVRSYYLTAIRPPSKADRSAGWKRATVTPVVHDYRNRRFSFRATVHYDVGGDYHVEVAGAFGLRGAAVISTWYDDATKVTHGKEIASIPASLRLAAGTPPLSPGQRLKRVAQVAGVVLIVLVAGVQAFVLIRERRQRRQEELALEQGLP